MKKKWIKDKVVVITGASSGIGEEIARGVIQDGGKAILLARNTEKLQQLVKELGSNSDYFGVDVADEKKVSEVFASIWQKHEQIDVLVNNAGMGYFKKFEETSYEEIVEMFQVNVMGIMNCSQAVIPYMKQQGGGHIVQIGSMAGKVATPKSSVYAATKHAVLGFTNALRLEQQQNHILVTAVNTGPVKTPFLKKADEKGNYEKNAGTYMLSSGEVAKHVVAVMGRNVREVNLPRYFTLGTILYSLVPTLFERLGRKQLNRK